MQAYLEQLGKNRTGFIRQMETFKQSPVISKEVKKGINQIIRFIEKKKLSYRIWKCLSKGTATNKTNN
jgi:hypothetical protein